jgi:hypothetical protein
VPQSLPKFATILGLICVVVGVGWGFVDVATDFRFPFLSDYAGIFLITLVVGIVLSLTGTIAWARHLSRKARFRAATCVFAAGLVVILIAPKNVHGPGMLLVLSGVCALLLSLALAMMGAISRDQPDRLL